MVKLAENDRVAFEAYQDRSIAEDGNISYSGININIGNGLDAKTGIFTAPKAGIYIIRYQDLSNNPWHLARLYLNGDLVTKQEGDHGQSSMFMEMLKLEKNDKVWINYKLIRKPQRHPFKVYPALRFFGYMLFSF